MGEITEGVLYVHYPPPEVVDGSEARVSTVEEKLTIMFIFIGKWLFLVDFLLTVFSCISLLFLFFLASFSFLFLFSFYTIHSLVYFIILRVIYYL